MSRPVITRETVLAGRLRDSGHLNYGKRGGGTIWQHTTIARLQAIDRPTLSDEETERLGVGRLREWSVDGERAGSLEAAIEALNRPPVLSLGEYLVLMRVPRELEWLRAVQARIAGIVEADAPVCLSDHPRYHAVTNALLKLRQIGLVQLEQRAVEMRGDIRPRSMPMICLANGGEAR